jgi:two-component system, sensor histidine kinase and response regulator
MYKILVIEDEQTVRTNILELLQAEEYETLEAENGQVGVRVAQAQVPDLIICDVMMPQLDGFGVLKALQQDSITSTIPFIFLTAKSDRSDLRQGMALGADDYLTKPFTRVELLDAIAARLAKQSTIAQLRQSLTELQQSNLSKDDFLSTVAHELRSPLANIKTAIDLLQVCPDGDEQEFYLQILQSECTREVDLLNDLLDLQRLDVQNDQEPLETVDLPLWLGTIVEPFQIRGEKRQQHFQMSIAPSLPPLFTDHFALQRIVTELLNNACKYTPPQGKISLEVFLTPLQNGSLAAGGVASSVTLVVGNSAEIPAKALPRIFDRFYRVPQGDRWRQGGSGLGLTLVQKLVDRLGGTLQVTSEAGWTKFSLQLPLAIAASVNKLSRGEAFGTESPV